MKPYKVEKCGRLYQIHSHHGGTSVIPPIAYLLTILAGTKRNPVDAKSAGSFLVCYGID